MSANCLALSNWKESKNLILRLKDLNGASTPKNFLKRSLLCLAFLSDVVASRHLITFWTYIYLSWMAVIYCGFNYMFKSSWSYNYMNKPWLKKFVEWFIMCTLSTFLLMIISLSNWRKSWICLTFFSLSS